MKPKFCRWRCKVCFSFGDLSPSASSVVLSGVGPSWKQKMGKKGWLRGSASNWRLSLRGRGALYKYARKPAGGDWRAAAVFLNHSLRTRWEREGRSSWERRADCPHSRLRSLASNSSTRPPPCPLAAAHVAPTRPPSPSERAAPDFSFSCPRGGRPVGPRMQSCLEYHPQHPQGSPHVTFRRYTPPHPSSLSPQPIKEEEPSGALTTASPGSGGGPAAVSVGGGSFYGSQHCYLPAAKKVDSLPRLGMLGGSTPGMYSVNIQYTYSLPFSTSRAPALGAQPFAAYQTFHLRALPRKWHHCAGNRCFREDENCFLCGVTKNTWHFDYIPSQTITIWTEWERLYVL